jgi:hypothetical protein
MVDRISLVKGMIRMSILMQHPLWLIIKRIAILVSTGAIGLELWHLDAFVLHKQIPEFLAPIFWVGRLVLVAHLLEAVIAAVYAPRQQKAPLTYAVYTFFVGTIGLVELFAAKAGTSEPN